MLVTYKQGKQKSTLMLPTQHGGRCVGKQESFTALPLGSSLKIASTWPRHPVDLLSADNGLIRNFAH